MGKFPGGCLRPNPNPGSSAGKASLEGVAEVTDVLEPGVAGAGAGMHLHITRSCLPTATP